MIILAIAFALLFGILAGITLADRRQRKELERVNVRLLSAEELAAVERAMDGVRPSNVEGKQ